ncbi:MAG TPA: hypothetical protein VJP02_07415 [Candidatus Sulfotelmatobacter sp.]|nr:hypothetical protein [Candidatus Sulfotelmatobacter sp.]
MRNWEKEIREHLASLDLPPETKDEVIAELASHLEDLEQEESRVEGGSQALDLAGVCWCKFARAIQTAKHEEREMNRRKNFWIPLFVNLLLTSALINICDWLGIMDLRIYRVDPIPLTPQPWLLVLPISGATAAFLARRSEGSSRTRLIAAVAPCVIWSTTPFVLGLIFLWFPQTFVGIPLRSLALSSVWLFVFPGLSLLLGAAPFLRSRLGRPECE